MNATTKSEREALDATLLELLFAHDPYMDWRNSDGQIMGAVYIDQEHPDEITATKRLSSAEQVRRFPTYRDAMQWAMRRT